MKTATDRAAALVESVRRRARNHALKRSAARGATAGFLLAAGTAAVVRLLGGAPGAWLLLFALPAAVGGGLAYFRLRPTPRTAALLLDHAARARERFTALEQARDPEVRELIARQALESVGTGDDRDPVRFPPSADGLAAALGLFLLVIVWIVGASGSPARGERPASGDPAGTGVPVAGTGAPGSPEPAAAARGADERTREAVARVRRGLAGDGEIPEESWRILAEAGLPAEKLRAARDALARGDRQGAGALLEDAWPSLSARGDSAGETGGEAAPPSGLEAWVGYRAALEAPYWEPEHDEIVRRYFTESRRAR